MRLYSLNLVRDVHFIQLRWYTNRVKRLLILCLLAESFVTSHLSLLLRHWIYGPITFSLFGSLFVIYTLTAFNLVMYAGCNVSSHLH